MIAYENCNEVCITLPAAEGLVAGMFCYIDEENRAAEASGGSNFVGYVKSVRNGLACVLVRGIITTKEHYEANRGWTHLIVDGICVTSDSSGTPALVLSVGDEGCTFML